MGRAVTLSVQALFIHCPPHSSAPIVEGRTLVVTRVATNTITVTVVNPAAVTAAAATPWHADSLRFTGVGEGVGEARKK